VALRGEREEHQVRLRRRRRHARHARSDVVLPTRAPRAKLCRGFHDRPNDRIVVGIEMEPQWIAQKWCLLMPRLRLDENEADWIV
jgi:hypothetical protein